MTDFAALLSQGTTSAWLFIPSAILLGALHGLEPGHSKTMMAAFIVAIRGTVKQAVMLGLAATLSHTLIVWLIALGGMYISRKLTADTAELWFQLISAIIILATALWMIWRTWQSEQQRKQHQHDRRPEAQVIDTGHGHVELALHQGHWRLRTLEGAAWQANQVSVATRRGMGFSQIFTFAAQDGVLQSTLAVPQPHTFNARLSLGHGGHSHDYDVVWQQGEVQRAPGEHDVSFQDAHERAHASDIKKRFASRAVTNGQIILFGLTGGLIPCPAAITVLLLCIQVKAFSLSAALVLCFSIGLALTLVGVGAAAALSVQKATPRWQGLDTLARRAPWFSGTLIALVAIYMGYHGLSGILH